MNLFFIKDLFCRAVEKKRALIIFGVIFLAGMILGICFVKTPAFYEFHLNNCDRFLTRVCYSDRNVFVIFLERTAGCALLLVLTLIGGVHIVAIAVPTAVILYRSYTFGGQIAVLFGVYGVSGAIVALVLYIPIHLLIDAILLIGTSISVGRARCFRFAKQDLCELGRDLLALLLLVAAVCLVEMILLLAIFHPLGNLF